VTKHDKYVTFFALVSYVCCVAKIRNENLDVRARSVVAQSIDPDIIAILSQGESFLVC
jgi:hypothetical protein